jgi:cold shock CspA family protein
VSRHIRQHSPFFQKPPDPRPPEPREQSNSAERVMGHITFYNPDKQIGFIKPDSDHSGEVFFGSREASKLGTISQGDRVSYSVRLENGGRVAAIDIKVL